LKKKGLGDEPPFLRKGNKKKKRTGRERGCGFVGGQGKKCFPGKKRFQKGGRVAENKGPSLKMGGGASGGNFGEKGKDKGGP